jgi:hypothetical protein
MSAPQEDGGPAFPFAFPDYHGQEPHIVHGMSLRDYFAAAAVTLFTLEDKDVAALREGAQPAHDVVAKFCYELADAMLAERKEGA